jgi:hypothetical protein
VKKEHFDNEKIEKVAKHKRKEKKGNGRQVQSRLDPILWDGMFVFENPGDSSSDDSEDNNLTDKLLVVPLAPKKTRGNCKANKPRINADLDAMINTKQQKLPCLHLPLSNTFQNNKAGKY